MHSSALWSGFASIDLCFAGFFATEPLSLTLNHMRASEYHCSFNRHVRLNFIFKMKEPLTDIRNNVGGYHCKHLMLFLISPKLIYTICIIDDNNTLGIMRGDAIWWARHPSGHQSSGTTNEITCIHQMKPRSSWVAVMGDQVTVIWTASGTSYFAQTGMVTWDNCCQAGNVLFLWILCY